jgi:hypothetical protein
VRRLLLLNGWANFCCRVNNESFARQRNLSIRCSLFGSRRTVFKGMAEWAYTRERQKKGYTDTDKVTKWKVTQEDRLSRRSEVIPDGEDKSLVYVLWSCKVNNCSYNWWSPINRVIRSWSHNLLSRYQANATIFWRVYPLLGNGLVNTFPQHAHATIGHTLLGSGPVNRHL